MPDYANSRSQRHADEATAEHAFYSLTVPALPSFEASNWEEVDAALAHAPALFLGQAWLPATQETFRPGIVRLGWQETRIIVAASLDDDSIFTRATADNQRLWELGDVFEIFLRNAEREDYLELHVAPDNKRLQLHFPSRQSVANLRSGRGRLEDFMVQGSLFDFATQEAAGRWKLIAQIPGSSLGLKVKSLKGRIVFASFSRYDYTSDGGPAVLSSTSPHAELAFHRQQEWTQLLFC